MRLILPVILVIVLVMASGCTMLEGITQPIQQELAPPAERCASMCAAKGMEVKSVEADMCYCITPRQNTTMNPVWRCFNSLPLEDSESYTPKFNTTLGRPIAIGALAPYDNVNQDALKVFALYSAVAGRVKYVPDPAGTDLINDPQTTWETAAGDCDDYALLLASMFEAVGFDAEIVYPYTESTEQAHAFVMLKINQNLNDFVADYEKILNERTNYTGPVPFNIMLFASPGNGCHELAEQAAAGNLTSFWLDVEGTSRDYAGAHDSMAGFESVKFFTAGG